MYYNNITGNEDDDLKFIPLNISEPFRAKDSTWFPIIDIALPAFSEIPNSFASSFSTPFNNSNVQPNTLKTLDFIQGDNANLQKNNLQKNNQQLQNFQQDFDLEYPSEIFNEELPSYNKNEKCKQNTGSQNMMQEGEGQQKTRPQYRFAKYDATGSRISKYRFAKYDATGSRISKYRLAKYDATGSRISKYRFTKYDATGSRTAKYKFTKYDATRSRATKYR